MLNQRFHGISAPCSEADLFPVVFSVYFSSILREKAQGLLSPVSK